MPQPYPKTSLPLLNISTMELMEKRPIHLMLGQMAIAEHSMVEAAVSNIVVALLPHDPAPAAAIFGTIWNGRQQREALIAAAKLIVDDQDLVRLNSVMALVDTAARGRDKLAHNLWGWDEQFPDMVVLIPPEHMWRFSLQTRVLNDKGGPELKEAEAMQAAMRDACMRYTRQDLEDQRRRSVRAFTAALSFGIMLKATDDAGKAKERETLDNLFAQAKGDKQKGK